MESKNVIWVQKLTPEDILQNKETIVQYIFESNTNCSFMTSYSTEDATNKWKELYDYSVKDQAVVCGAFANCDGKILMIGFVWAYAYPFREDLNRLYVSILHVQKEYRSAGIGKQLMEKVEEEALVKGYRSVYLHAEGFNERGIRFYNKNGYEQERVQLIKYLV